MSELIQMMATNIDSMTLTEKLLGGTVVTVFAMGIVFIVLVLLMYIIKGMSKFVINSENRSIGIVENTETKEEIQIKHTTLQEENLSSEEEVVAAIIAAINASYSSSQSKIVIRNIVKNDQNNWASAGLLEQINSRI